jgi:Glycosyltransferase family 87
MLVLFMAYAAMHYSYTTMAWDFPALWSYARLMLLQPAAELYDVERLHAFQVGLGMDPSRNFPFPYPPTFLLLVWPLGLLPQEQAYCAWVGLTLAAFVWSVTGSRPNPLVVLAILAAPASTVNVIAGQSGFLSGALLIGGLRLIGTRPWLGGLLLGLLTYKPQLGLLVPIALVAAGAWRGIGTTACATLLLVALTMAMFGGSIWLDWLASLSGYSAWFAAKTELLPLKPTVLANLALLGVPEVVARALQLLSGGAMAVLVWFAFRRGVSPAAIGVLAAATVLANPHALFYDLPPLTAAVLFLGAARLRTRQPLRWWETLLMVLTLCLPVAMLWSGLPLSLPVLLAFTAWAAWQVRLGVVEPEQPRTLGVLLGVRAFSGQASAMRQAAVPAA